MQRGFILTVFLIVITFCSAQTDKDKERFDYVSKQLALSKETKAKLRPLFYAYRKDLKNAKNIYDELKEKNITAIKKKKITTGQANALNNARWTSDQKVAEVKKQYCQKFGTILTPQQVYYLFSYANDSKSKRLGK